MIPRRKIHIIEGEFYAIILSLFKKNTDFPQYIAKWETTFARYLGVRHAIAVSSGRSGMEFILRSLELNRADEVIIPAYTLKDLIGIIQFIGLVPVPADIHPETFNIDPISVAKRLTECTKVILATHLFGTPCQIDKILEMAKQKSIFVIEDCAHSVGSEFKGRKTGSFGDASFFSLDTTKPINSYGGGVIATNNTELAEKIRKALGHYEIQNKVPLKKIIAAFLENWLLPTPLSFPALYLLASGRWNKKMSALYRAVQKLSAPRQFFTQLDSKHLTGFTDFQAFVGLKKLKTLDERNARRREQASLFKSLLSKKVIPQQVGDGISPNYYFFVALLPSNIWEARRFLLKHGIDAGIGAEIADDCGIFLGRTDCPNAREVFQHAIQLPLHEEISLHHIQYVTEILGKLF